MSQVQRFGDEFAPAPVVLRGVLPRRPEVLRRRPEIVRGPANVITLTRAVIGCVLAALVLAAFLQPPSPTARTVLVLLAALALVLDGVDGKVARRTGTVTAFGARFDLETDAFLILVLSVDGARTVGWWVLAIGAARYTFLAAGRVLPWLRGSAPPRHWCKVVAVVQGVALTVVAAGVLPVAVSALLLAIALVLLAESFGREAWQLWRLRTPDTAGMDGQQTHRALVAADV